MPSAEPNNKVLKAIYGLAGDTLIQAVCCDRPAGLIISKTGKMQKSRQHYIISFGNKIMRAREAFTMIHISKFESVNGKPDEEQVLNWTDAYFFNLMNIFNSFLSHLDVQEAASRLRVIPFDQLTAEQLEGESEEVINLAVARIKELLEAELEFMDAYA
ncbi:MAG TPA: hypothetical protein PKV15_02705 [Syntrophomonadaceae bacterium]|nr:hypothetical protein [Syntrophomonadaceae bacterium]HRX20953.1 hypothetical protein [Syntrophomonadaceae bacterium]